MLQNKVDKLISLRFVESTDPIVSEALAKLQDIEGTSFNEVWQARTELVVEWYKCWLAEQQRQYEGVAGNE